MSYSDSESVRDIHIQAITLQISISETYILLAGSAKDALQAQVYKRRAFEAFSEASALVKQNSLPDGESSAFHQKLQSIEARLNE